MSKKNIACLSLISNFCSEIFPFLSDDDAPLLIWRKVFFNRHNVKWKVPKPNRGIRRKPLASSWGNFLHSLLMFTFCLLAYDTTMWCLSFMMVPRSITKSSSGSCNMPCIYIHHAISKTIVTILCERNRQIGTRSSI
jgi:hypothetical protein